MSGGFKNNDEEASNSRGIACGNNIENSQVSGTQPASGLIPVVD
jgi:hypothetical protein